MKWFSGTIFLVYFVAICYHQGYSKPIESTANTVYIVESEQEHLENGYKFSYKLSDGQSRQENGFLKNIDGKDVLIVQGSYSFVGDNGETFTVYYEADENGYRVLDRAPSIPEVHEPPILALSPNIIASLAG